MTAHDPKLSRRSLLAGAGALVIGIHLPRGAKAQSGAGAAYRPGGNATFAPNAFIRVAPDSTVTVLIKHIEFGQGPFTGLATLAAEEMDAAWSQMRAEHARPTSSSMPISPSACRAPAARPPSPTAGSRCAKPAPLPA